MEECCVCWLEKVWGLNTTAGLKALSHLYSAAQQQAGGQPCEPVNSWAAVSHRSSAGVWEILGPPGCRHTLRAFS